MVRSLLRRERPGLPPRWRDLLAARSAQWALLGDGERGRLGAIADELLRTKRWEAANGVTMTDEIRTLVAAHAALLVLGLDESWYDGVGTIVIRRGAMRRPAPVPSWGPVRGVVDGSPGPIDGDARDGAGPVMINWTSARREAANPRLGRDVTMHEFAHKLDMRDRMIDGTPFIADEAERRRWVEVCTTAFEALRAGTAGSVLRPYAATNPGEFFAVATETFFTRPVELASAEPALYDVLRTFFRQDPAARVNAAIGAGPV
jgi:Mlc titration factor MtfA (ptsG expression regulator)